MTYPINDGTKKAAILTAFEDKFNEVSKTGTYEIEITKLRTVKISDTLKSKLVDNKFGKTHIFEEMPCNHAGKTALEISRCQRCQFNKREIEAETLINSLTGNEKTIKVIDGVSTEKTLVKLVIDRGSLDDVKGYIWHWQ